MIKYIAAACLLGTALATAPAFAQNAQQSNNSGNFLTQMSGDEWRGSKLVGVDVYGSDNQKIGDINEVIVDRNGQAKAIVIGVGGFLGIGEKNVAVPWEKVQWNTGGDQSSGSMASNQSGSGTMAASSGGQPAGDRSTPRDVAQTTTGSPNDPNAQPAQTAASGGAALSSAPSSGTAANAPANSSPSVASTSTSSSSSSSSSPAAPNGPSAGRDVASSGSPRSQDYPDRALVSMSKQDLQNAPDFHYNSQSSSASGSDKGGAGGSSLTGR